MRATTLEHYFAVPVDIASNIWRPGVYLIFLVKFGKMQVHIAV